jgi:hypothetical protein
MKPVTTRLDGYPHLIPEVTDSIARRISPLAQKYCSMLRMSENCNTKKPEEVS